MLSKNVNSKKSASKGRLYIDLDKSTVTSGCVYFGAARKIFGPSYFMTALVKLSFA